MKKELINNNPIPEITLFPNIDRLMKVATSVGHFVTQRHTIPNTGGVVVLDRQLDEHDMERYWQGLLDYGESI